MPTDTLMKEEHRATSPPPPASARAAQNEVGAAARNYARRVRRLRINVVAWVVGTILLTTLWVVVEWNANGAFDRFAHEGNPGDWNPTLWTLAVGLWGLAVGIMALRVHFERPVRPAEVDRYVAQLDPRYDETGADELRRFAYRRLEGVRRLKFHAGAWVLGMVVITPINVLIEWQDNGAFERVSGDSQPGSWDPWILAIGGIWALVIAALALRVYLDRPKKSPDREAAKPT